MDTIVVPNDQIALFNMTALDAVGVERAATGTLTTSNPGVAYIAKMPPTIPPSPSQYCCVSRAGAVAAGTSVDLTVTVNATNDRGVALPAFIVPFSVSGPPLPPPATHLSISGVLVRSKVGFDVPVDPGSDTIAL